MVVYIVTYTPHLSGYAVAVAACSCAAYITISVICYYLLTVS
jgi:hypothetical protein